MRPHDWWWREHIFIALFLLVQTTLPASAEAIRIPLKFHIITDFEVPVKGVLAASWITPQDIESTVMPEVNRIWRPASIQWKVAEIIYHPLGSQIEDKQKRNKKKRHVANFLAKTKRNKQGKSNPKRIKKLTSLLDLSKEDQKAINVYLTPYLGRTSQGNARRKQRRVFITQWSDKMFKGKSPPVHFPLVEGLPMRDGSLSRTVAHELGHILTLKHPIKPEQTKFNRLMGGKKPGYELTYQERELARVQARELLLKLNL